MDVGQIGEHHVPTSEPLMMTLEWILMITNFAERVQTDVAAEFDQIETQRLNGEIREYIDLERAENFPLARLEIGARAVAYEVVAVVEQQLHAAAEGPWLQDQLSKRPGNLPSPSITELKPVTDLPYRDVVRLVEKHHGVILADLPGWAVLSQLRAHINSFKHRAGWKHPREVDWAHAKIDPADFRNEITFEQEHAALDALYGFVRALHSATRKESRGGQSTTPKSA